MNKKIAPQLIEKLVVITLALISQSVQWGRVFASVSPYRKKIVLDPGLGKGFKFEGDDISSETANEKESFR